MRTLITFCFISILCFGCEESSVGPVPGPVPGINTAAYKLEVVDSLAKSYHKGLRLMTVSAQYVNPIGTSGTWSYQYSDTSMPPTSYWFHSSFNMVIFDSTHATGVGSGFITQHWFNSDSALYISEQNGGTDFRSASPHCTISASVGIPVVPDPRICWYVTYRSVEDNTKSLMLIIDAASGEIITTYR